MIAIHRLSYFSPAFGALFTALMVLVLSALSQPAWAQPSRLAVGWSTPHPSSSGLRRIAGDGDNWAFGIDLAPDVEFVKGPQWGYPASGGDQDWGAFSGGDNGSLNLDWSSPVTGGNFVVTLSGRIRHKHGPGGGGGGGGEEEEDISASWSGTVVAGRHWVPDPAPDSGQLVASRQVAMPGQWVELNLLLVELDEEDTWTDASQKSGTGKDTIRTNWEGPGQYMPHNSTSAVWIPCLRPAWTVS